MGAVNLRGAAWILPETPETTELFQWLVQGSTWVTRPRPHIDRIASAWLIKRLIDPQAKFLFADPADAAKKGVPFAIEPALLGSYREGKGVCAAPVKP